MNAIVPHLASLSSKIILLGGIAWTQLFLLRRAPAPARSRLCALALVAILLLAGGELLTSQWTVNAPVFAFTAGASAQTGSPAVAPLTLASWLVSGLAYLWIAGAALMLLRVVAGRTSLAMLRRRSTQVEPVEGVEVRMAKVQTPLLTGLLRPAILLPESADTWTAEQRGMVLTHELTHFRQGDCWTNLLGQILRAAFWFHPVVWLLVSRSSREQELTCDEAVVANGHSPHKYAEFLLDAVGNLQSSELLACPMAGSGARTLQRRFANLLNPAPRLLLRRRIVMSMASFAVIAMSLTLVHPVWSQDGGKRPVYKAGNGVSMPKLLHRVDPEYTPEAKADHIEGTVLLKLIVSAEGNAEDVSVVKSLNAGLDQKAIEALAKWKFQPGTKDGRAVAVYATIEINFHFE